jgi:hypothetical protein
MSQSDPSKTTRHSRKRRSTRMLSSIAKTAIERACLPFEQFQKEVGEAEAAAPAQAIEAAVQISPSGRSLDAISSTSKFAEGEAAARKLFGKNAVGNSAEQRKFAEGQAAARAALGIKMR